MTQEDKDLLLKYLCMALPYDVVVRCYFVDGGGEEVLDTDDIADLLYNEENSEFPMYKPYLRTMSSMTDEQAKEIASVCLLDSRNILSIKITDEYLDVTIDDGVSSTETITLWYDELISSIENLYWLLEHHFDFIGLIPKDLAIEVTEENNPYKD